jgi:hypothetical protein
MAGKPDADIMKGKKNAVLIQRNADITVGKQNDGNVEFK